MELPESDVTSDIQDKHGRRHLKYPHTGPMVVYLRNNIFHNSTCLEHVNDLFPICSKAVKNGKGVFIAFVDNGPDYNPTSVKNILLYSRLWRQSGLDFLVVGSHASGDSAYNCIGHGWALLSRRLTSVTLSATLEGEELPPCKNAKLADQEKREKEAIMLDIAADDVSKYWTSADFDGFCHTGCSNGRADPILSADDIIKFLEASVTDIKNGAHKRVLEEYEFVAKHIDRRHNEVTFSKCQFFAESYL